MFQNPKHVEKYSEYRPNYPSSLFQSFVDYQRLCCPAPRSRLAVDVGCGSGQSTFGLCRHFDSVVGVDKNETQLQLARDRAAGNDEHKSVLWSCCLAEKLDFLENDSVDLVTIGQALHWVEADAFYLASTRILRPGGVVVAYGYGMPEVENRSAQDVLLNVC